MGSILVMGGVWVQQVGLSPLSPDESENERNVLVGRRCKKIIRQRMSAVYLTHAEVKRNVTAISLNSSLNISYSPKLMEAAISLPPTIMKLAIGGF